MATIKVKFRPSSISIKEGTVFYQIIHERIARQINAGYKVYASEWEKLFSGQSVSEDMERSRYLSNLKQRIKEDLNSATL